MRALAVTLTLLLLPVAPAGAQSGSPGIPADIFPRPSGPFTVGVRDELWIDSTRGEPYTRDRGDRRHLMVQIWYPASAPAGAARAPYVTRTEQFANPAEFAPVLHVRTNSVADAPLAAGVGPFPVLIYNHGGAWSRFTGTFTAEELASHGYVVVSVEHPGFNKTIGFPDGYRMIQDTLQLPAEDTTDKLGSTRRIYDYLNTEVFPVWVADARFVLDRLETMARTESPWRGRLDLARVGAVGWSMGGAVGVELTIVDPRVKAAVDQDGQLWSTARGTGSSRPVFLMHSTTDHAAEAPEADRPAIRELVREQARWDSLFIARSAGPAYELRLAGADHGHFSDLQLFYPTPPGKLDPRRGHTIINAYTLAFFDRYLKGLEAPILEAPPPYPEVTIVRSR